MEKLENWKQRPLSQVVSRWIRGTTLNRSKTDYYTKTPQPESLPWARVGDIKEEYISQTENYLTKEGADQIPWLVVPKGAVLLSVSGTIGKAAIAGCDMTVNQAIQAMVFDEEQILPEYACFYLEFYRPWLIERANAVTIPNLTKEQLSGIPVVFPCLKEQKVIVDRLKRARQLVKYGHSSEAALNRILENALLKQVQAALKEGKISRDEELLSPELRSVWTSLQKRVLPENTDNDFFVPVLSQAEQTVFTKTIRKAENIRKRLHKMQQLGERYFKSMLSLAFTSGLTEAFRKQEALTDPSPSLFKESYGIGTVQSVSQPTEGITDWQSRIPQELQSLFTMLSDFQMEILRIYAQSSEALPVHTVFKQIHKKGYSVQDALASARLLEALGFLEKTVPQKLYMGEKEVQDSAGHPITIQKYQILDTREV